jgi:xanthine/uracil permease
MVGSIILVVLGIFILIGLGNQALKDFNIPSIAAVILLALIVGLNFIPPITTAFVTFRIGSLLLYLLCAMMFFVKGKWSNRLLTLLITLILAGLVYGSTRLALLFDNAFWGRVNVFYALIVGFLAMLFTRNAKYSFISSVLAILIASLLTQIGGVMDLDAPFIWAVVAGSMAVVTLTLVTRLMPSRPNRMSYYFEAGRMLDE